MPRLPLPSSTLDDPGSFEGTFWHRHLERAQDAFAALDRLLSNQEARDGHLQAIFPAATDPRLGRDVSEALRGFHDSDLSDSHDTYRRQMIVILASLFEGATKDFFTALFTIKPEHMGDLSNEVRPKLRWEALNPQTRDEEMTNLAAAAGTRVMGLKAKEVMKWLETLARGVMHEPERAELLELVNWRHRIVHQRSEEPVSTADVVRACYVVASYLECLSLAARENGLRFDVGYNRLAIEFANNQKPAAAEPEAGATSVQHEKCRES